MIKSLFEADVSNRLLIYSKVKSVKCIMNIISVIINKKVIEAL